jgi:hypothetical protein
LRHVAKSDIRSEQERGGQIGGIVRARITARTVVVRLRTVELQVARVLRRKTDVHGRPPGEIQDVPVTLRNAGRASAHRRLRVKNRVRRPGGVEESGRG